MEWAGRAEELDPRPSGSDRVEVEGHLEGVAVEVDLLGHRVETLLSPGDAQRVELADAERVGFVGGDDPRVDQEGTAVVRAARDERQGEQREDRAGHGYSLPHRSVEGKGGSRAGLVPCACGRAPPSP